MAVPVPIDLCNQQPAHFGALATGFGARPAVVQLIGIALRLATLANIHAGLADCGCRRPTTFQIADCHPADFRTIERNSHAVLQGIHIRLMQGTRGAMVACDDTVIACGNTGLKQIRMHGNLRKVL